MIQDLVKVASNECGNLRLLELKVAHDLPPPKPLDTQALRALKTWLADFVPAVVQQRAAQGKLDTLAEMRVLSILFISLQNVEPEFHSDGSVDASRFQAAAAVLQHVAYDAQGFLKELVSDDKGSVGVLMFGVPPVSYTDGAHRAVQVGLCIYLFSLFSSLFFLLSFSLTCNTLSVYFFLLL